MRRGRFLRSSLMPVNSFFSLFPGNLLSGTFREGLFSGGERDFYAFRTGVSIFFQDQGFPFCFFSAAWDLPVRLLPSAALFFPFLSNAEAHRSVISLTGEQYLYYVSFHCFVSPACLFFLRSGVPRPIRQKPKALPGFLRASGPSFSSAGNTSRPSDTTTTHLHPSCPFTGREDFFFHPGFCPS